MGSRQKIFLISLGCAKNLVDSEHILGLLEEKDFQIVSDIAEAEIAIINTCAFIQSAVEESIETILDVASLKKEGSLAGLYVAGCFVQRYGNKLKKEIPEVDGWIGTGEIYRIADIIRQDRDAGPHFFISRPTFLADHHTPRVQITPFFSAYLKIAEGCSHRCSYCTIPSLRGPYRSRKMESLLIEAETMVRQGVKEINLIAQDTTQYGSDLNEHIKLEDLLEGLLKIKGLQWIRALYCHPHHVSETLLDLIDREERICPYLDIPLQHVNGTILRMMGRPLRDETAWQFIDRIRSGKRPISLRATLMVGFPNETASMFQELYDFVAAVEFDRLGVFVFSPEKGTYAARLEGQVKQKIAERRRDRIMRLQAEISAKNNQRLRGRIVPVLIEGFSSETDLLLRGRTADMAPDVDGQVLINKGYADLGEIAPVLITEAHAYDLVGEIVHPDQQVILQAGKV